MAKQPKLKSLLEDIFNDKPQINKYEVVEGVKSFNIVGKSLYNNSNIMEIAKQVSHIAEQAHTHVLGETDDWFDQVSVNKNMQSLKKRVAEFKKTAQESHQLNQRLTGLYEDMGHILNRYYDINEDAGDMDNDGLNEPDDEEYLDNKRDAIIIFHSNPGRKDLYFGLPTLKLSTYEKWDLEFRVPVLHLYWSEDHKVYTFKNGISFLSLYHEVYGQQTCKWLHPQPNAHNWKYNPELQKFVIHHMDINGNFQLAMKVVDIFKKELYK